MRFVKPSNDQEWLVHRAETREARRGGKCDYRDGEVDGIRMVVREAAFHDPSSVTAAIVSIDYSAAATARSHLARPVSRRVCCIHQLLAPVACENCDRGASPGATSEVTCMSCPQWPMSAISCHAHVPSAGPAAILTRPCPRRSPVTTRPRLWAPQDASCFFLLSLCFAPARLFLRASSSNLSNLSS
jgi:hypothetical protein